MSYTKHDPYNLDNFGFRTGDLLLFRGNSCISFCIECCTQSKFSHCGLVIKDPKFTPDPINGLFLLESTGLESVNDVENKEIKFGVQLRDLKEVIRDYDGHVYWRQLDCKRGQDFHKKLVQAHSVAHNRPYDDGFDYIKALFDVHIGNVQNKTTFFCSALCAYVYCSLGLLSFETPWSIVTPKQLSSESNQLHWQNCILHEEVKIS